MPSQKRNPIAQGTREPTGSHQPSEPATETRASAPRAPVPHPPRGAAVIPAPRKSELHRVSIPLRPVPTREEVARRAYEIWQQSGCACGRDRENWAQAERELLAGCSPDRSAQQG
ncbi:MAG TPA: DUF2934 domain-containing protein [Myxococcaceae bacterium]|nr:DUF2934 domain-containing protein [Myxococcaceae bacterium]